MIRKTAVPAPAIPGWCGHWVSTGNPVRACLAHSRLCSLFSSQHQALSEYRPIWEGRQLQRGSPTSMADKKLILIPFIFICLRVWSTVRFVLTLCGSPAVQAPVLVVLHVRLFPWALPPYRGISGPSVLAGWAYGKQGSSLSLPCPKPGVVWSVHSSSAT